MTVQEILSIIPLSIPIPLEAIKHLRGFGGLKALYQALRRSRAAAELLPPDNEPIIQLSERNAFYWLDEGCQLSAEPAVRPKRIIRMNLFSGHDDRSPLQPPA